MPLRQGERPEHLLQDQYANGPEIWTDGRGMDGEAPKPDDVRVGELLPARHTGPSTCARSSSCDSVSVKSAKRRAGGACASRTKDCGTATGDLPRAKEWSRTEAGCGNSACPGWRAAARKRDARRRPGHRRTAKAAGKPLLPSPAEECACR